MKRKQKETGGVAAVCQLRTGNTHPFGVMKGFTPLGAGEERIYREMREAIPVLDAAVAKWCGCAAGLRSGAGTVRHSTGSMAFADDALRPGADGH